jgi:glutamate synthase (NADPH/NADH) small chain
MSMFTITRKQSFNEDTFLMEIQMPAIAASAHPGQYVDIHINVDGPTVTLPSAGTVPDAGTFTVVEQGRDLPSERLMVLGQNDEVFQVRGPLGSPCAFNADGKVVLMGEDLGVASLLWRAREIKRRGAYVIVVIGFPARDRVFWHDEFATVADELYINTTDGSFGVSGRITGVLQAVCETHKDIEQLVMIARLKSMKRGAKIATDNKIDTRVNFDAIRYPVGTPGLFDAAEQETFAFARAAELDADLVDFDKLIARERALATADSGEPENASPHAP